MHHFPHLGALLAHLGLLVAIVVLLYLWGVHLMSRTRTRRRRNWR